MRWQDQVIEMALEGIMIVSEKGVILAMNPGAERIFRCAAADVIGRRLDLFIPSRYRSSHQLFMDDWSESGEPNRPMTGRTSVAALRADGTEFRADISLICFRERGEVRFSAVIRDVTAREEQEEEARKAHALAEAILDRAPSLVAILDATGRTERINRATERLLGLSQEWAMGKDAFAVAWGEADREAARARFLRLVATGQTGSTRETIVSKDGLRHRVLWVIAPILGPGGGVAHVICMGTDVTQQEQAEERFRELFEGARDLIITTSIDGAIRAANRAAEALSGYPRDQLIGMNALDLLQPGDRSRAVRVLTAGARAAEVPDPMELGLLTSDGETVPIEVTANPLREHGEIRGFHVMACDIRERKRMEQERAAIERALQESQRLEAVGLLAAGIAHDFNNVLAAISGNTALAGFELPSDSPAHEFLHEIERASRRAGDLAHQLLTYAGKSQPRLERIDLNALVAEMTQMLRVSVPKGIELRRSFGAHLPYIEGDPTQLRQVVLNLITNAAEAISGEGIITISTSTLTPERGFVLGAIPVPEVVASQYVAVKVRDTGKGMDAEMLQHVFEPFFTTKQVDRGRGLGLAAVIGIVRSHGGVMKVRSTPGEGTAFSVYLPARPWP